MKSRSLLRFSIFFLLALILTAPTQRADADNVLPSSCDVVWTTSSADARGSMPLGNGEVGLNAWVEPDGDLQFYISRSNSYSEVSRLLKVGLVRVAFSPNPFTAGAPFVQHLHLQDGYIQFHGGTDGKEVDLRLFVDSDHPVIHLVGWSQAPEHVTVSVESWRTAARTLTGEDLGGVWTMGGAPYPLIETADHFAALSPNEVMWYHRDDSTCVPSTLALQGISAPSSGWHDPILHRTFGAVISAPGFTASDSKTLVSTTPATHFALQIACPCAQTASVQQWEGLAKAAIAAVPNSNASFAETKQWWHGYWNSAWVKVTGDTDSAIPGSDHPLRIGDDSNHENVFPGTIGRADVYDRVLTDDEIKQIAGADRIAASPVQNGLVMESNGFPKETPAGHLSFKSGLTLCAWIDPQNLVPGRIFDRLTAGQSDGFLFDTYPGNTLRLIDGTAQLSAPDGALKSGSWQFVSATIDGTNGAMEIAIDGTVVASASPSSHTDVTQAYQWQRYMQACGGRGEFPIKFNGGQFTVSPEGTETYADTRHWGDAHWWQNIRHIYYPMLAEGDFDMMKPFFAMYENAVPLGEESAKFADHVSGCFFPETMTVWGTYANSDYGWDQAGPNNTGVEEGSWHKKTRNQGPELVAMMLDYWDYTQDRQFLKNELVPMADAVLTYFDQRFSVGADGKLLIEPTQAIETLWSGVADDTPTVAGLGNILPRLVALPSYATTPAERALFARLNAECPSVPLEVHQTPQGPVTVIAPAAQYDPKRSNCENPETYAIWPFHLYGVDEPGLQMARETYAVRIYNLPVGWGYDGNCAAVLGLADESSKILLQKCANSNPSYRWPATWGPNFDWLPDQNHGGNLLNTTQLMLLQNNGRKILLFPAWPKNWNVDFKLHTAYNTTVEAALIDGKVTKLIVQPEARLKDVELFNFTR